MIIDIPLMKNNIRRNDLDALVEYLRNPAPRLTQGERVEHFESAWSRWLGVPYSVFVNSGSSANLITMAALKHIHGEGEVIVPALTWSSDVSSVIHAGLKPVFVDADPKNLGMNVDYILKKITRKTRAVFLTHVLGFNALSADLLSDLKDLNVILIEDVCESHGATFNGKRLGSYGMASNFSYYFAHHMSTIEGGMVCTADEEFYETIRMLRSHGMVREIKSSKIRDRWIGQHADLNPQFIFAYPGYNVRSTELNAVLGIEQLKSLDDNNMQRIENCALFYRNLDPERYRTDFDFVGSVNYAFVIIMNKADNRFRDKLVKALEDARVEHRRGTSGGGNQLRQPYLTRLYGPDLAASFPVVDHIHFYGFYVGNYPGLEREKIMMLCELLNSL